MSRCNVKRSRVLESLVETVCARTGAKDTRRGKIPALMPQRSSVNSFVGYLARRQCFSYFNFLPIIETTILMALVVFIYFNN